MVPKEIWKTYLIVVGEALPKITDQENLIPASEPSSDRMQDLPHESNWFAAFTCPRHEKRVEEYLGQRDIENYLPVYRSPRKWRNGLKVVLNLPLFPGYIFVHIKRTERIRVLGVPGVLAIVGGTSGEMAPLQEAEVEALRRSLHLRQAEPHPLLTIGQRVRIRSGALTGLEGFVVRKKNSLRCVLTMDLIMQSIAVEVDEEELEPINSAPLNHTGGISS